MKRKRHAVLASGLAALSLAGAGLQAAPFTYNPQDLLIGFRGPGSFDYVVDIGNVSQFGFGSGTHIINAYAGSELSTVFGGLDGISFSVFGDVRTTSSSRPFNTLWVTEARTDLNTQSTPWNARGSTQQGTTAGKIDGIANGALMYSGTFPAGPDNTATAVTVTNNFNASPGVSYKLAVGGAGNFSGTFPGDVENTTPTGFAAGGTPIRSDLYELQPGSGPGNYLGYFQLNPDGSMLLQAVPEPGSAALLAGFGLLAAVQRFRRKNQ